MTDLAKAIYKTLVYFDIFEYPLTLLEVKKWLWKYSEDNLGEINSGLEELINKNLISREKSFYCLKGREKNISTRIFRYRLAEGKIKKVKKYLTWLSLMPGTRGIFICNNLAFQNSRPASDIDLIIITKKNKIWTARFFTTSLVKILGLRPTAKVTKDRICLSFFVAEGNLNLEKLKIHPQRDIYLTYWIDQLLPMYQTQDAYGKFRRANKWVKKYLPQSYGVKLAMAERVVKTKPRRLIKKYLEYLPGEGLWKKIQLKMLPAELKNLMNKDTRVIINDGMLKFHATDNREKYQQQWLTIINKIDSL